MVVFYAHATPLHVVNSIMPQLQQMQKVFSKKLFFFFISPEMSNKENEIKTHRVRDTSGRSLLKEPHAKFSLIASLKNKIMLGKELVASCHLKYKMTSHALRLCCFPAPCLQDGHKVILMQVNLNAFRTVSPFLTLCQ